MRLLVGLLAVSAAISSLGCVPTPAEPQGKVAPPVQAGPPALPPEQVHVQIGDEKALEQLVAAHKGQPVFVDYWATWCGPCVKYFPHTVEIGEKYKAQGLAVVAVSFDQPDEEAAVRTFLSKQRAGFENLICSYGLGSEAFDKFAVTQVPFFRLYDRAGKLVKEWDSVPENAEAEIEKLLGAKE